MTRIDKCHPSVDVYFLMNVRLNTPATFLGGWMDGCLMFSAINQIAKGHHKIPLLDIILDYFVVVVMMGLMGLLMFSVTVIGWFRTSFGGRWSFFVHFGDGVYILGTIAGG